MPRYSNTPLQPNPFLTYRDPQTGIWKIVNSSSDEPLSLDWQPNLEKHWLAAQNVKNA